MKGIELEMWKMRIGWDESSAGRNLNEKFLSLSSTSPVLITSTSSYGLKLQ